MPPESDPHFKKAFAELHRRQCAEAPAVEAMLSRARRAAPAERRPAERPRLALRFSMATAGVCLALFGLWRHREAQRTNPEASARRVEQLLAAIEQQLEISADFAAPEFPTDTLLSQNPTDPYP